MKNTALFVSALLLVLGLFAAGSSADEPDSLKLKNEMKTANQGEVQKLKVRTEERTQNGDPAPLGEQNRVRTRNEGEEDKRKVRTEEGDKTKGQAVQTRFRDENGDGIPDSTQAQKKERNRSRVRSQEKKQDGSCNGNLTPQGAATGARNRHGSGQESGSGRP